MRPRREHVVLAMALGLLASLSVHLPIYGALGVLADELLASAPDERPAQPHEPVFMDLEPVEEPEPAPAEPEGDPSVDDEAEGDVVTVEIEDAPEPPPDREPEAIEEEEEEEEEEPEERAMTLVEPQPERRIAVTQRSQDPNVETPDNARFIADENNRTDQETVAQVRSLVQDDPDPNAGEPQEESEAEDEGNADEYLAREMMERESEDERVAGREQEEVEASTARESQREGGRGDGSQRAREDARRARAANAGGQEREAEMETIVVSDGVGTFTIQRPRQRGDVGSGGGDSGGERRRAVEARRARGGGAGGNGPNLRIGWSQFQAVIGEEQLAREREEYAQARLSKQRGRSRERRERWRQFRTAIENYVASVRPGNQTSLNAAASPFAGFIAEVHRRLHVQYHEFLDGMPIDGPMSDMSLQTTLEIIFRSDGTVERVGVVRTSGTLPFDYGAFAAVMSGQPYPTPPRSILSGDDRVYMHWTFKRDQPFCHQEHAAPYILPNPPPLPGGAERQLTDGPEWGSTVPASSAAANYGLDRDGPSPEPEEPEEPEERRRREHAEHEEHESPDPAE